MGVAFTIIFILFRSILSSVFLHDKELIAMSASFLRTLSISAPFVGIINLATAYFQALGKAMNSLIITMFKNIILFVPAIMVLGIMFGLSGLIAAQPVSDIIVTIISIFMYKASGHTEK
ncbi:hypothetical protein BXO88_06945 [Oribacterium sp. C9]|uniref:MATE family efflux transporter n=1 Tax=Oribacterium sp. C9 TaxID=1943579 RepID=UPI00098EAA5F|nr:MATE family efflux transporter [Oribacterium sp. C9]OON86722.1 hypothetical protein BXO88_06945 [Oribacterium sp. C9]